ncbi:MAG: S41 family peptidase [bacterium]
MKKSFVMCLFVFTLVFSFIIKADKQKDSYEALKPFMEVYALIQENYVDEDKTVPKDLVDSAIKGMVQHIDPFSQYMNQMAYKDMSDDTKAQFGGLGIEISVKDGQLIVVSPIEDTPAYTAGIKSGDKIMLIDGDSTDGLDVMDAVHKLRGEPGTKVTISIQRGNVPDFKDYILERAIIKIETARCNTLSDDVGYIRINQFMGDGSDIIEKGLKEFNKSNIKKLVIDLRDDPGGLLDQAVKISDFFLPKGDLIVYTEGRSKSKGMEFKAENDELYKGDIVVLINGGSASASEILSGALQDHNRAIILGTQSFGKGSVQTIIPLSDKSALRLTTATYMTPSGKKIHGVGITPDIVMEEEIPSTYTANLYEKNIFEDFVKEYLKKHPEGIDVAKKESVKVSESDIKVLFKKDEDQKLMEEFRKYLKLQKEEIKIQELAQDRNVILKWIKVEIANTLKGRIASRKAAIENDSQVKRAIGILNTMDKLKKS